MAKTLKCLESFNAGKRDFIMEMTRVRLVRWCSEDVLYRDEGRDDIKLEIVKEIEQDTICIQVAKEKGWISRKDPNIISSTGFKVAAAFLRR